MLCLLIRHRFVEWGFSTAPMGGLYIPGSSSIMNEIEYLCSIISMSLCSHTNRVAASSSMQVEWFNVVRSVGLIVVNSHRPSLKDLQTDSTRGWFGCCHNSVSNLSTLIGVMILKRLGWELMVIIAATLLSSDWGMEAKGAAVSVDVAEGVLEGALWDQRKHRIHHCHCSKLVFLRFFHPAVKYFTWWLLSQGWQMCQ